MQYDIHAFSLPKMGESSSTNQDRWARSADGRILAISDGAGSSLYPGEWASILVNAFSQDHLPEGLSIQQMMNQWLPPLQQEWRQFYLQKLQSPTTKWWQGGLRQNLMGRQRSWV